MALLANLLLWPVRGLLAAAENLEQAAQQELNDPDTLRQQLLALQLAYEMGEIDEAEYQSAYQTLTERLQSLPMRSQ